MRHERNVMWVGLCFGLSSLFALALSLGCVGTPLPDPPSASAESMLLTEVAPNAVRLAGSDGAIHVGAGHEGASLRVTIPRLPSRVETTITPGGAFSTELPGAITDTLYLELVDPDGDVFLVAVADGGAMDDAVVIAAPGGDRDGDLSPDAIDCAPDDPALVSLACMMGCTTDAECASGQVCSSGTCVAAPELCGNGVDDDLDGLIDDGCACRLDSDCFSGQLCMAGLCSL